MEPITTEAASKPLKLDDLFPAQTGRAKQQDRSPKPERKGKCESCGNVSTYTSKSRPDVIQRPWLMIQGDVEGEHGQTIKCGAGRHVEVCVRCARRYEREGRFTRVYGRSKQIGEVLDVKLAALRAAGLSYKQIGALFNITHGRARYYVLKAMQRAGQP